jgi:hypothetical protein
MRSPLRLGAAAAIGLGALLLATVLASPALAWHSTVTVNSYCLDDGRVRAHYTVTAWQPEKEATVDLSYELNGKVVDLPSRRFTADRDTIEGNIDLPGSTTGTIVVTAEAHWVGGEESTNSGKDELPPAGKCEKSTTTTSESTTTTTSESTTTTTTTSAPTTTTAPSTTVAPSSTVAPTTSVEETTTTAAVGATTSTAGGGRLPFTGASSGPMLLAGIVLVGGGSLFLLLSRARDGHATK